MRHCQSGNMQIIYSPNVSRWVGFQGLPINHKDPWKSPVISSVFTGWTSSITDPWKSPVISSVFTGWTSSITQTLEISCHQFSLYRMDIEYHTDPGNLLSSVQSLQDGHRVSHTPLEISSHQFSLYRMDIEYHTDPWKSPVISSVFTGWTRVSHRPLEISSHQFSLYRMDTSITQTPGNLQSSVQSLQDGHEYHTDPWKSPVISSVFTGWTSSITHTPGNLQSSVQSLQDGHRVSHRPLEISSHQFSLYRMDTSITQTPGNLQSSVQSLQDGHEYHTDPWKSPVISSVFTGWTSSITQTPGNLLSSVQSLQDGHRVSHRPLEISCHQFSLYRMDIEYHTDPWKSPVISSVFTGWTSSITHTPGNLLSSVQSLQDGHRVSHTPGNLLSSVQSLQGGHRVSHTPGNLLSSVQSLQDGHRVSHRPLEISCHQFSLYRMDIEYHTHPWKSPVISSVFTGWTSSITQTPGNLLSSVQSLQDGHRVSHRPLEISSHQFSLYRMDIEYHTDPWKSPVISSVFTGWTSSFTKTPGNLQSSVQSLQDGHRVSQRPLEISCHQFSLYRMDIEYHTDPWKSPVISSAFTGWTSSITHTPGNLQSSVQSLQGGHRVSHRPLEISVISPVFTGWTSSITQTHGNLQSSVQSLQDGHRVSHTDPWKSRVHTHPWKSPVISSVFTGWTSSITHTPGNLLSSVQSLQGGHRVSQFLFKNVSTKSEWMFQSSFAHGL